MTAPPPDRWLTVAEIAAELRCTERQAWNLLGRMGVERLRVSARETIGGVRVPRAAWEAVRGHREPPPAAGRKGPVPKAGRGRAAPVPMTDDEAIFEAAGR